jgi:hypothetical protein
MLPWSELLSHRFTSVTRIALVSGTARAGSRARQFAVPAQPLLYRAKVMASTRHAAAARATLMGRQDRMRIAQIALRHRVARLTRRFREARALARAFQWPHRPIVAQIIPTRRCNLSCAYCYEFDRSSARSDHLPPTRSCGTCGGVGSSRRSSRTGICSRR